MGYNEAQILELATQAYKGGEADFRIDAEDSALLVIDMQDEFVKPGWMSSWVPAATRIVPALRDFILACRRLGMPVIYTVFSATHNFLDRPKTGPAMPNRFPDPENEGKRLELGRVWRELEPHVGDIVIHKPSYGAFFDTPLDTILKNLGKGSIIVTGTLTNCCCGTTARQGYERGYKVAFCSDLTATYTEEMQEAELGILRFAFARVMSSAEILGELA
jgi:nicotinamidase-related amidase